MSEKHPQEASPAQKIVPDVYRVPEAAERLNVSERTIRRLVKNGELRALPQLRHLLIPRSEVERLLDVRR
ncbi:helix-turn-helix domain-containing protein [Akkermansiaceae bacterium]|nr:helix-turn-helix domain-containing protein [Akkermansiaceae bacterium]